MEKQPRIEAEFVIPQAWKAQIFLDVGESHLVVRQDTHELSAKSGAEDGSSSSAQAAAPRASRQAKSSERTFWTGIFASVSESSTITSAPSRSSLALAL